MSAALLAPLRHPAYRAIWVATLFSNFGIWIQMVAAAWLMTSIAPTVDFVAWVQAATALPPLVFTLVGGVLADRIDQRLIFLVAQLIVLTVALALSVVDQLGLMTPWLLLGLTFALDSGSALRYPAYQTTIVDILPRHQLASALVLASVGWNIARAAGPGIGGLIIAAFGVPTAFAVNALCNVFIVIVLVRQRRQSAIVKAKPTAGLISEILGGFRHVRAVPAIRWAMLRCFLFTLFASALWSLLPLVAKRLAGTASSYGLMLGALGLGALAGAGLIGWMRRSWGLVWLYVSASLFVAATTLALVLVQSPFLLLPVLVFGGLGWMMALSTFTIVVQLACGQGFQGRVVAIYYISLFGGLALGSYVWGHVAALAGVDAGLLAATIGLVACLVLYRDAATAHGFVEGP